MRTIITLTQFVVLVCVFALGAALSMAQDPELAVVSEPKRFKLYEAPHALNTEARRGRIGFLTEQLKLKALPAAVIAATPDLYQPPESNQ